MWNACAPPLFSAQLALSRYAGTRLCGTPARCHCSLRSSPISEKNSVKIGDMLRHIPVPISDFPFFKTSKFKTTKFKTSNKLHHMALHTAAAGRILQAT